MIDPRSTMHPGDPRGLALLAILGRLLDAAREHELILLRETSFDAGLLEGGDVDLLAPPRGAFAFLERARRACAGAGLHLRIVRADSRKVRLGVLSADLERALHFDLWLRLWQVFGGRRCLAWRDLRPLCAAGPGQLLRVPAPLELAIYVEHLHAQGKNLAAAEVRARLAHYAQAARGAPPGAIPARPASLLDRGARARARRGPPPAPLASRTAPA